MILAYPPAALSNHIEGKTTLKCDVTVDGKFANCVVLVEQPRGWKLGQAAIELADHFKVSPMLRDGLPAAGGTYTFTIQWGSPGS